MRIFKSKTSKFTVKVLPNGKQICIRSGGSLEEDDRFIQPGQEPNISQYYFDKWFIEISYTNYLQQCEQLMNEK